MREIAASAGVTAALVIRYFGSKENLFVQAVVQNFSVAALLDGERARLGERLARYVLQKESEAGGSLDPLLALLRSATNEQAAALLRTGLDAQFIGPLADWLGGPEAEVRAGFIAATLLGLTAIRSVLQSRALFTADTERLVAFSAPVLQGYIDGPVTS